MADPLSVAGSAVGIVSLGLQVSQGLITYYSHFKAHDEEIAYITRKSEALQGLLQSLEGPLRKAGESGFSTQVKNAVIACEAGLKKLNAAVEKYGNFAVPPTREDKLRALKKRTLYPFRRATLQDLNITLEALQGNLQLAVDVLTLETIQSHKDVLISMSQDVSTSAQNVESLVAKFDQLVLTFQTPESHSGLYREPVLLASMCAKQQNLDIGFNFSQAHRRKVGKTASHQLRKNVLCSCPSQPQVSGSKFYAYRYNLSGFWSRTTQHTPRCPQYRHSQRTDTIGAKYTYCTRALGYSIAVVMSLTRGASGFSISPQLTLRAVVPESSPAFQLIDLYRYRKSSETTIRFSCSFDHVNWMLEQLYALFQDGKASPVDVLPNGMTLLHSFYQRVGYLKLIYQSEKNSQIIRSLHHFTTEIINAGANPLERDDQNKTILTYAIDVLSYLRQYSPEIFITTDMERGLLLGLFDCGHEIDESILDQPQIVFEVPAILKTIFLQNEDSLKEILMHSPESANQVFVSGMTPLHFAAFWPGGLSILLGSGAIVSSCDDDGYTPLFWACCLEQQISMKLLLDHDSPLGSSSDQNGCLQYIIRMDDVQLSQIFISHLVDRRKRLLELALKELPASTLTQLDLKTDRILDAQAAAVASVLLEHGIDVDPALMPSEELEKSTVYHTYSLDVQTADTLYTAGFRDIDEVNAYELTPFGHLVLFIYSFNSLEIPQWLRHKGANTYLHSNYSGTALHALGAAVGKTLYRINKDHVVGRQSSEPTEEQARIASAFLEDTFSDDCNCACSKNGCRIMTSALKRQRSWRKYYEEQLNEFDHENLRFSTSLRICEFVETGVEEYPWIPFEVIRTMTFEWLGLTHTCHMDPEYWEDVVHHPLSHEEIHEIQDEERFLIQQHEELVAEFESKYTELGAPLTNFLRDYWWPRIHEVLDKNDKGDEEEERKLRELGVVLEKRDDFDLDEDEDENENEEEVESNSECEEYESADEDFGVGVGA